MLYLSYDCFKNFLRMELSWATYAFLRHYIHAPYLFMAGADALILFAVAFLGYATRYGYFPLDMVFCFQSVSA